MRATVTLAGIMLGLLLCGCEEPTLIPSSTEALPPPPVWSQALIGKTIAERFKTGYECKGFVDVARVRYGGARTGVALEGWAWDGLTKTRADRVLLTNSTGLILGAGEGGRPRPDVPKNMPEVAAQDTGWVATTSIERGEVKAWVLQNDGKTACFIATFAL